MRLIAVVQGPSLREIDESVAEACADAAGDGVLEQTRRAKNCFACIPTDDPRPERALGALHDTGFSRVRMSEQRAFGKNHQIYHDRSFEASDLEGVTFVRLAPSERLFGGFKGPDEVMVIDDTDFKKIRGAFGHAPGTRAIYRNDIRDLLKSGGFFGLAFRDVDLFETQVVDVRVDPTTRGKLGMEPWQELAGDTRMPTMAPSAELYDRQMQRRLDPGTDEPWQIKEPENLRFTRLPYRRSDLEAMEGVDVAEIIEGAEWRNWRIVLVSTRLCRFLLDRGYDVAFTAIKIEDG